MGVKEVNTQAKPEKRDKSINERGEEDLQELSAEGEASAASGERTMLRRTLATVVLLVARRARRDTPSRPAAGPSEARSLNLSAYAELLRSDVRAEKVAIITEVMGFTEAEDAAFWPIYREYDAEMAKLGDERVALIADYAKDYATLTDAAPTGWRRRRSTSRPAPGREGEVLREGEDGALAADGAALPPGRAPAAAADRSADLRRAAGRAADTRR